MNLKGLGKLLATGTLGMTLVVGIACGDDDTQDDAVDAMQPTATDQNGTAQEGGFVNETEAEINQLRGDLSEFEQMAASMDEAEQDALQPLLEDLRLTIVDLETHLSEYGVETSESEREATRIEIEDLLASAQNKVEQINDVMNL